MNRVLFFFAIFLATIFSISANAQVRITEFMASNASTLADEDGDFSDWIEIQNTNSASVNLLNWSLTDSASHPTEWTFPATNISAGGFMIIFASGKNRAVAGQELHTNFKLSSSGEYLALVKPDGTIATQFSPEFPPQFPDVSYGIGMQVAITPLVATNAPIHYLIPTNSSVDAVWTQTNFDDSSWQTGTNGIGYETGIYDPAEQAYAQQVLQTHPVAYWRLNETNGPAAVNIGSQGIASQAGYNGGVLPGQAGPRPPTFAMFETNNNAPYFNGANAYIGGPYQMMNDLAAFTVAGWINSTGTQGSRTGLFGQNDLAEFGFTTPTDLHIFTQKGSLDYTWPYPNNQWHFVAATGNSNQIAIYVDGNLVASKSVSGTDFGESGDYFNIGGGGVFDATNNWFLGQIDEVAVWYRALSTNEIASLVSSNAPQISYTNYISTDVKAQMYGSNATAYVRIPFNVADPSAISSLQLLMRYDDGFVAFLNGHQIFAMNAPATLAWNSIATQRNPDYAAIQLAQFNVTAALPFLQAGSNVLAIQALNINATNTDFLMQAQLLAQSIFNADTGLRYFTQPTPGALNGISAADQGPVISGAGHLPNVPTSATQLVVTSRVAQAFNSISNVTLNYRVMFNSEISAAMNDSGTNGDAVAGDGIWTGIIPVGVATAGQMIRYYVTASDTASNVSRWPFFVSTNDSAQYLGTVVADPSVQSLLPVVYLFIQNTSASDTQNGAQASLFYLNEFYDNLNISAHGQSSAGWPKKSHNMDFVDDHPFLYQPNGVREGHVIFMSDYSSKARMSTTLAYNTLEHAGSIGLFSFPIRIHLNGSFFEIEDMVERGDDLFLTRVGLDPNGALYKMYNNLSSASGNEKKTRTWEGTDDLTALINNLNESLPLATRVTYGYDNLDLPQTASYFATMALVSSQDLGHKNYYLYHDNDGTGEWMILPWDLDLTFGRDWVSSFNSSNYFNDVMFTTNILNFYPGSVIQPKPANSLFDLFFASADFQQMYLRRLRTLMDNLLMPSYSPTNYIESQIRQSENLIDPTNIIPSDATLDYAAWGPTWGNTNWSVMRVAAEQIVTGYLAGRRTYFYTSPMATLNGVPIPAAQPTNAVIYVASWDYNPVSGNQAEQYVELRNTNSYAVDVSNWHLTGAIGYTMRPGTVIPAGKSLYLAANVNAFRARATSPSRGQNLYVQGSFSGFLSTQGNSPLILENDSGALVSKNSFAGSSSSVQFASGNLAVLRVGDGVETLSGQGNSVFIDQLTTNGTLVSSLAIPDNDTNALIVSGSASSEGALTRSADGRLLVFAGYQIPLTNAAPLTISLANTNSTTAPRALGVLDTSGNFTLVGVTTNQYSLNNMRGGATDGRGDYWGAGANSGTFYFGGGATNTVQANSANTIEVQELGGNLYFTTQKNTNGIWKISGTPAVPSTASVLLNAGSKASSYAFAFSPSFTNVYIADDTVKGVGGIQRWDFNGTSWTMSYAFSGITNVGARGVTVDFSGANPIIYATTAEATNNRLVAITDTGAASTVTPLATAGVNQLFRGVAFTPDSNISPQFFNAGQNAGGFALTFTTLINRNYTLEYTADLGNPNWITLTNLTTASPVLTVTDITAPANTNRFYRIILNP
jgi:CotH kinase protein/Concanavalin A-like lectin/glucanases superfamily/Lamin Tail Domain